MFSRKSAKIRAAVATLIVSGALVSVGVQKSAARDGSDYWIKNQWIDCDIWCGQLSEFCDCEPES